MARIRSVKPGYFTSLDTAGTLSRDCRLHFAGLWTYADDHGRGVDEPRLIKAAVWPLDDDIQRDEIEALQDELRRAGRIIRYVDNATGRRYFQVVNWHDHQKPNRPQDSSHPAHDADSCTVTGDAVNVHGAVSEGSSPEWRGEERRGEVDDESASDYVDALDEQFAEFWDAYPRHAKNGKTGGGGNRKTAFAKWKRMTVEERDKAMRAAANYRSWVESPDGEFPKHANTWLNADGWDDWLDPPRLSAVKDRSRSLSGWVDALEAS